MIWNTCWGTATIDSCAPITVTMLATHSLRKCGSRSGRVSASCRLNTDTSWTLPLDMGRIAAPTLYP